MVQPVGREPRRDPCQAARHQEGQRQRFHRQVVREALLRRADEGTLGRAVVEAVILLTASRGNASHALRDAATAYKVDTDAIAARSSRSSRQEKRQKTLRRQRQGSLQEHRPSPQRKQ